MNNPCKVAVLGGGSFGTVLANIAASNGNKVALWVRDSEQALRINSEGANSTYHPELQLSSNIQASECLEDVMKDANIVLIATPSIIFENIIQRIAPLIELQASVISCTKGIKLNPFRSMSDIISENIDISINNVGVLSGPNLAREIADNKVAGTVIASSSNELIANVKVALSSELILRACSESLTHKATLLPLEAAILARTVPKLPPPRTATLLGLFILG